MKEMRDGGLGRDKREREGLGERTIKIKER